MGFVVVTNFVFAFSKMKHSHLLSFLAALFLAGTLPQTADAGSPVFGVGQSGLDDSKTAGAEAARKAKAALGDAPVKLVIVFAARPQVNAGLIEGVASVFEKSLVYGCEGYSSLTQEGNFTDRGHDIKSGVSVMAIGGDISLTPVSSVVAKAATKEDRPKVLRENGKAIGGALKDAFAAAASGKLILTFGNQHVGDNQPYVEGVLEVLGKDIKMVGAAAGGDGAREIVRGEIVKGANVGVLMTGNFKVRTSGATGDQVKTADETLKQVMTTGGEKPSVIFVFDCGGRRAGMVKAGTLGQELQAIKMNAGSIPFFGFYGGGEIGHKTQDGPCVGVGNHIAAAAVIPQAAPAETK